MDSRYPAVFFFSNRIFLAIDFEIKILVYDQGGFGFYATGRLQYSEGVDIEPAPIWSKRLF